MAGDKRASRDVQVERSLRVAQQEMALVGFIRAKRTAGVISDADARTLEAMREELYREQGIWTDPGDQQALRSGSEIEAIVAVLRQGYHLIETKLLELYPGLKDEVRQLRPPSHER